MGLKWQGSKKRTKVRLVTLVFLFYLNCNLDDSMNLKKT